MVLVTPLPEISGSSHRERRLWVVLSEWMTRQGCTWVRLEKPVHSKVTIFSGIAVGLVVVRGMKDLEKAVVFREQFPHGRLVTVVLSPDPQLLMALQKFSPCFIALDERDDAAVPQVLERLGESA
ncbi:MAG: hypothetical protein WHS46_13355 [Desulfosoma sp.]